MANRLRQRNTLTRRLATLERLERRLVLTSFTAYNVFSPVEGGSANVTTHFPADDNNIIGFQPLKDIATGDELPVSVTMIPIGPNYTAGVPGANAPSISDASNVFDGFADLSNGIELGGTLIISLSGLDPTFVYDFAATASHGNPSDPDKWTSITIGGGAESFTVAHSDDNGVVELGAGEIALLWTGGNASRGNVVQWTDIVPNGEESLLILVNSWNRNIPESIDADRMANSLGAFAISAFRLIGRPSDVSTMPIVENAGVTDVSADSAELGAVVSPSIGEAPSTSVYYGTTDGGTDAQQWQSVVELGREFGTLSTVVSGLEANTQYFYRTFAANDFGESWAAQTSSFETLEAKLPTISNHPATAIGATTADLNGLVEDTGNQLTTVTVFYGDNDGGTDPDGWDSSVDLGETSGFFRTSVSGLNPQTANFITARAVNASGVTWATPSLEFTTQARPQPNDAPVEISEFATNNDSFSTRIRTNVNEDYRGVATTPDWIELRNPTESEIDLGGFFLSDDADDPLKWEIPFGTFIAPDEQVLIFASGNDIRDPRLDERGIPHTNFRLRSGGGEDVVVSSPDGQVVSAVLSFPPQSENTSFGISDLGESRFYESPTPGAPNPRSPSVVEFNQLSQSFVDVIEITLTTSDPTDSIYYTLDGSVPTADSTIYDGPIELADSTQVRTLVVGLNGEQSMLSSETYVRVDPALGSSNLPLVVVSEVGSDTFVGITEPDASGETNLSGEFTVATRANFRIRGRTSQAFPKKQYRVEFVDERGEDRKLEVLGMPAEADWILYGPGEFDRNLLNNPLIFDLSNQIDRKAVRTEWVEMYLNEDGDTITPNDYLGVYAVMEVIEIGPDRVEVGKPASGIVGVPGEGAFIWENESGSGSIKDIALGTTSGYVNQWIRDLEFAAAGPNATDPERGYAAWADVGSFIDHHLLNVLALNVDALRLSTYYTKPYDGLLEAGPIWDFDRAFNSRDIRTANPTVWDANGGTQYFDGGDENMSWWSNMFQDADFVQQYIDRWYELRQSEFSTDNLFATIDSHVATIGEAAERDDDRWNRGDSFASQITSLKNWIRRRVEWIDSQWLAPPTVDNGGSGSGDELELLADEGQVYYTLDGTDPRGEGGVIRPEAILADGPLVVGELTAVTARTYLENHGRDHGYIPTGDDWSPLFQEAFSTTAPATRGKLAITEVYYHPTDPTPFEISSGFDNDDDFEYIEVRNLSSEDISLNGVRFVRVQIDGETEGVAFDFPTDMTLAPGEHAIIAEDMDAFAARFGADLPVVGQWRGALNNRQEQLTLLAKDDSVIDQVGYGDRGDWPQSPDGAGDTLARLNVRIDGNLALAWIAASPTPGRVNFDSLPGDFDANFDVNAVDVDLLFSAVRTEDNAVEFDIDDNGRVDDEDVNYLVETTLNTRRGDINLDGKVNFQDFLVLGANFGGSEKKWEDGDFNGDGDVNFADFLQLSENFGFDLS